MEINSVGIDIVENKRIKDNPAFIKKVLSEDEINILSKIVSKSARKEFLAGRWAVKEAIFKATQTRTPFNEINIINTKSGLKIDLEKLSNLKISLSHEKKYSVGIAIA